jgi:Arc/MetJ family transcription regulator
VCVLGQGAAPVGATSISPGMREARWHLSGRPRGESSKSLTRSPGPGYYPGRVIFKSVRDGRPYPDHGLGFREWAQIPPHAVRLDQLITTKGELALDRLLADDSTFYGDLFPHVVEWQGEMYLEDGVHRALRAALQQRNVIHARVYVLPTADAG